MKYLLAILLIGTVTANACAPAKHAEYENSDEC